MNRGRHQGRTRAFVTGGSGEIGAAIARRLSQEGMDVIVHANQRLVAAEAIAAELRGTGAVASACAFDVSDEAAARTTIESLLAQGPIQVLVNNAGAHDDAPLAGMSATQWRRVIDINLNGFYNVTQPLLLPMIGTRWGRIVSVSSVAAILGNRGQANYAAAKAGLHGASRALAIELGARGITVNVVAPGIVETSMTAGVFGPDDVKRMVPLQRTGSPQDVAETVAFLVSDGASYITGQVIPITGGMT